MAKKRWPNFLHNIGELWTSRALAVWTSNAANAGAGHLEIFNTVERLAAVVAETLVPIRSVAYIEHIMGVLRRSPNLVNPKTRRSNE
jgi:hypothetical protein